MVKYDFYKVKWLFLQLIIKTSSHVAQYVQISSTFLSQKWIRSLCLCCGIYQSQREMVSCCVQLVGAVNWVRLITDCVDSSSSPVPRWMKSMPFHSSYLRHALTFSWRFITAFTKSSLLHSQKFHYCIHKCLLLGTDLPLTPQFFT
jgi:hypothetical protein